MSAADNTPRATRHARGKRPVFYATPGLDEAMSMIVVLAQELSVLRDRVDAIERVSAKRGIDLAAEIEALVLDQAALDARELQRQQLLERLYYVVRKEAKELQDADSKQRYDEVINETAQA
ncbi:hypothetical protein [Roseateles sp. LKC17W]|uniref:Flagellar protein FliT n=1 Tax=Pelomonas margarita TaxID=3299031 RepID=A0ABW7FJL7_9BURK